MNINRQWYLVYTKPQCEKKAVLSLTKRRIDNFCPLNRVSNQNSDKKKWQLEPLFPSYVFVKATTEELMTVKQIPEIISVVYWLGKPAVIREVEIDMMQRFLNEHMNVRLEKTRVNVNDIVRIINESQTNYDIHDVIAKNKLIKLILPTLGYNICTTVETFNVQLISSPNLSRQKESYEVEN